MSTTTPDPADGAGRSGRGLLRWPPSRRTGAIAGAAGLVAIVVGLGLAGGLGAGTSDPGAEPTGAAPTATSGSGPTRSTTPHPSPTPEATAAAPAPTAEPTPDVPEPAPPAPPRTEDVPADAEVPPREVPELPPVPLSGEADFGTDVSARLTSVARVEGEGQGLGEESGPALAVTIEMSNGTPDPVDLSLLVVSLADAAGNPGQSLFGDPRSAPFTGPLDPGASRTATYVLRLPAADTTDVTVTVSYGAQAPTAVFSGPVPSGVA